MQHTENQPIQPFDLRWPAWVRWAAVLPAMLLFYVVANLALSFMFLMAGGDLRTGYHPGYWNGAHGEGVVYALYDIRFACTALMGLYYGSRVAPRYCRLVLLVVGGAASLAIVVGVFYAGLAFSPENLAPLRYSLFAAGMFPIGYVCMALGLAARKQTN